MSTASFIGIDPGTKGAVSVVYDNDRVECFDVPTVKYKIGKTTKLRLDVPAFIDLMSALAMTFDPQLVVIEEVGGLPKQSAPNAFTFGKTTGAMVAALYAAKLPFVEVPPSVWKRRYRLSSDKDKCRMVAGQLLPAGRTLWSKKTQDGRAEAALLALYARDTAPAPRKPKAAPRRKRR
ncbi:hypothetical protein [Hyphomicrobium sp. DY-1]|uniref:hypothetical protein n=1 Tax=Hyphomicrobium sp. DY-1 TaxID=3075650 RepID=UPI0039C0FA01